MAQMSDQQIVVTATRRRTGALMESAIAVTATEEQLGDLKLYRVPEPVTVAAKGLKQVAFLNVPKVESRFFYKLGCDPSDLREDDADFFDEGDLVLAFENERKAGLGRALPQGGMTLFEPTPQGTLLIGEDSLRDYAEGQSIELDMAESTMVFGDCAATSKPDDYRNGKWVRMVAQTRNASPNAITVRFGLGWAGDWEVRGLDDTRIKDGERIWEATIPGNSTRRFPFRTRYALAEDDD